MSKIEFEQEHEEIESVVVARIEQAKKELRAGRRGVEPTIYDPLNRPDDGKGRRPPALTSRRSTWVYIRALGRVYLAEVEKTVPLGDGRLRQWPRCYPQLDTNSTLSELLTLIGLGCKRVIWHPFEDFLRVPATVGVHLDKPREYVCVQSTKSEFSKQRYLELGRVTYCGPSPTTGHGVGQFEVAFGGRHSPYRVSCDRLSEAQHLLAIAFGLAQRDSSVTYLCELP